MKDNIIEFIRTIQVHGRNRILAWIETTSGKINGWAWDKRWKERNHNEWIKGYKK